uniref:Uncharacterized protein n=1 Tax=Knipowitschia caucasica TaxID=637954 RepID=A0AAV2K9F9_KNICA
MNTAGGVCLSVLSSLLAVAGALAAVYALALAPLSALAEVANGPTSGVPSGGAEGPSLPLTSPCSSLVTGECLRTGHNGDQEVSDGDGCGMSQTGCICPNHNIMAPAVPLLPETPHTFSNGSMVPDDCCVTELHSNDAIAIAPRDVRQVCFMMED